MSSFRRPVFFTKPRPGVPSGGWSSSCSAMGILATNLLSGQVALNAGDVATKDIFYSGRTLTFTSELKTAEARTRAAQEVAQVFHMDRQVLSGMEGDVTRVFHSIDTVRKDSSLKSRDDRVANIEVSPAGETAPGGPLQPARCQSGNLGLSDRGIKRNFTQPDAKWCDRRKTGQHPERNPQ